MNHYKVSVIIPVYNVESFIREALLSALNQTFKSIEYIIVDDHGKDRSMEVVREVQCKHPRGVDMRICVHEKNSGLSAARNTGIAAATGEYIFFMDSDDEITPDCIEQHYNALANSGACFTIGNIELVGAKSIHVRDFPPECVTTDLLSTFFLRKWSVSACNKLYRKNFLQNNGLRFQEGLLQEDILWSYQLCLYTDKAAWVAERTYVYKVHEASITHSKVSSRKIESMLFTLNTLLFDWESGTIKPQYRYEFAFMLNFYRLNTALLLLNYVGKKPEAKNYYKTIQSMKISAGRNISLHSMMLWLPFPLFRLLCGTLYSVYKKIK